jgi:hypothetical protein
MGTNSVDHLISFSIFHCIHSLFTALWFLCLSWLLPLLQSLFIAKASGEPFEERLNKNIERHADFGEIAPLTFIPLLVLLIIRWRMDKSGANVGSAQVRRLVSILLALAAILALVYIYLTGHSGAESVWGWIAKN